MSGDLLVRVIAAGMPADLVAEIARLEARVLQAEQLIEGRRAGDRRRQQARRDRDRAEDHVTSRDITDHHVTTRDVTVQPAPSSPPLPSPQTPQPTPPLLPHPDNIPHEREAATKPCRAKPRWPKAMPPPEGVSDEQWAGFVAHRIAKRQPLTPRAYDLLVTKLATNACDDRPPGALVDLMVERGWLTFEPDWLKNLTSTHNGQRPHHDRNRARGLLGAVLDAEHDSSA